ncbi:hypothetical protein EG329_002837 [Mollisiaceae sp. DMI_Dod_QoI]|nr:hypothetical protein EG329_002837 [Helotiales sp. DMI_Dod_QoI]
MTSPDPDHLNCDPEIDGRTANSAPMTSTMASRTGTRPRHIPPRPDLLQIANPRGNPTTVALSPKHMMEGSEGSGLTSIIKASDQRLNQPRALLTHPPDPSGSGGLIVSTMGIDIVSRSSIQESSSFEGVEDEGREKFSDSQKENGPKLGRTTKLDPNRPLQDKQFELVRSSEFHQPERVETHVNQLTETAGELEASHALSQLKHQVKELQKDLQDAHDFIFALQPRRQITAPEAAEEFKIICATVEDWVQTKLGDVLDDPNPNPRDVVPNMLTPHSDKRELYDSIKSTIIEPTTTLAQKLQLAVDSFTVEWTHIYPEKAEDISFSLYDCQNLVSGRALKFPAAMQDNHITYLFDVYPGLYHRAVKANVYQELKVLVKPKILVAATKLEDRPFAIPAVRRGRTATLVGWLDQIRKGKKCYLARP